LLINCKGLSCKLSRVVLAMVK